MMTPAKQFFIHAAKEATRLGFERHISMEDLDGSATFIALNEDGNAFVVTSSGREVRMNSPSEEQMRSLAVARVRESHDRMYGPAHA